MLSIRIGPVWDWAGDNSEDKVGDLIMATVLCKAIPNIAENSLKFQAIVGTSAHSDKIATQYLMTATTTGNEIWNSHEFLAAASTLRQIEPLVLGSVESEAREEGLVSLFKDFSTNDNGRAIGQIAAKGGGYVRSFEIKADDLGDARGVFSHLNPWG